MSPAVTTQLAPKVRVGVDLAALGLVARADDEDEGVAADVALQRRLRHQEGVRLDRLRRTRAWTNMPGSSTPCGLGKRARSVTVPVLSSTVISENWTVPV